MDKRLPVAQQLEMLQSSALDHLPPELLIQIMGLLETPRDLWGIIRASRIIYQIFQHRRVLILTTMVKKIFPYGDLNLAITACEAASITKSWHSQNDKKDAVKQQSEFMNNHKLDRVFTAEILHNRGLLDSMCRLWSNVEYFLCLFEVRSLRRAAQKLSLTQNACREMSKQERSRVQRAFLTFEIHRRITPVCAVEYADCQREQHGHKQTHNSLAAYRRWELEALLSVEEFLIETARDIVTIARDHIHAHIYDAAHEIRAARGPHAPIQPNPLREIDALMDLELYDPFWSMHPREARCLHSFAAKGLPFMKWALSSPPSAKVAICVWAKFAWVKEYISSPSILEHLYRTWDKMASPNPAAESPKEEGALNGPNEGWMWAEAHDLAASQSKLLKRFELRMIGYCYWDS
jgi:hypothetical protein